ncbi:MAG: DUF1800 family protein [Verrucomicrobiaceae bacterium]|nr:DUF1800 family protein [Verrucomicrobiaceae bacterium]
MRFPILSLIALPILAMTHVVHAIDDYSTGPGQGAPDQLDDVWQAIYNGWGLVPSGDEDSDGCSNLVESIAGSDPRKPGDCLMVGNMAVSGSNIVMNFASKKGKSYQVWQSNSPGEPSPGEPGSTWTEVAGAGKVSNVDGNDFIVFPKPGNAVRFYRLEGDDHDSDSDGVSDWAEHKMGTDINASASATNASGGAASDYDTLKSLMSLQILPGTPDAFEKEGTKASVRLQRSFGTMPLTIALSGESGSTLATKASASAGDYQFQDTAGNPANSVTLPANEGVGSPYEVAKIAAIPDSALEVPEALKVCVSYVGAPPGTTGPETVVNIKDANPADHANRQLYVAFLGREAGAASTASGYATALVDGANNSASVSVVFNNLSSDQNTAYIRIGPDLEVLMLPLGQVSGANWNIRAAQTEVTDQRMLDALKNGQVYVAITTVNFPDKEIYGYFNRANGSETFDDQNTNLDEPALGSALWQIPVGDALEREIWRFMNQATMGGTTALYTEIRAKVDEAISGGGTYIDGLRNWMDEQIDINQTPYVNHRLLLTAADMEEFALRGNKPSTYNNDPNLNSASLGVSFVNGMPVYNSTGNPDTNAPGTNYPQNSPNLRREWWTAVTQSKAQLRERMAQALSEICVVSERDATVLTWHYGAANWWDMLALGAFGKYRSLLEQVSMSPIMGVYLTSVANRAAYDANNGTPPQLIVSPDENYAREIMQLFSIGLVLRHPDGSLQLSSEGLPIATYDNNDITELARVFTGFSHGARHGTVRVGIQTGSGSIGTTDTRISPTVYLNGSGNNTWFGRDNGHLYWQAPWIYPMKVIGRLSGIEYHDYRNYGDISVPRQTTVVPGVSKRLLAGKHGQFEISTWDPTGRTDAECHAQAALEVSHAHDVLAGRVSDSAYGAGTQSSPGHTNTPVNLSRWLIQRLVTSNPSSGYIYRVQKVWRDTNGDLGEVSKAILLDYEARSTQLADNSISWGRVKEPLMHFTHVLRQFKAYSGAAVSFLRNMDTGFSDTDAPMTNYPATEVAKFDTSNVNPPSKPNGWPDGPFRFRIDSVRNSLGQSPLDAPSVFNWFYPDFTVPGNIANSGLVAPEMQTITEGAEISKINFLYAYTWMTLAHMSTTPGVGVADFIFRNGTATPAARFALENAAGTSWTTLGWPASITLNESNWSTGVNVRLTAVNNQILSQLASTNVRYTVSGTAPGYSGISTLPTNIDFVENESAKQEYLIVTQTGSNTWVQEGGPTDVIQVRLGVPPAAGSSVDVTLSPQNGEVTASPSVLTFTDANWNVSQTSTVTASDDSDAEDTGTGNDSITITASSTTSSNFDGVTSLPVTVNVVDNDNAFGVQITQTDGVTAVTETSSSTISPLSAGMDTYTIVLTKAPTANVTVNLVSNGQLAVNTSPTGNTFTNSSTTRVFTSINWNVPQQVVVRGNNDTTSENNHWGYISHSIASNSGGYVTTLPVQQVVSTIVDDDNAIMLSHTGGETRVMEGGDITDTITVRLRTNPNAEVSLTLSCPQLTFSPSTLTFVPTGGTGNLWNVEQTVTVKASEDYFNEGIMRGFWSDSPPLNASATSSIATGSVTSVTITNPGAGYTGVPSVSFGGAPTGGTTATGVATINEWGQVTGVVLTNRGAGYTAAPSVSIGAAPAAPMVINAMTQSAGTNYNGTTSPTLPVTIIDNDDARVVINQSGGSTIVGEDGTVDSYTITLGRRPEAGSTTTVTLVPSTTGIQVSPTGPFTFTDGNWNTPVTVTVTTTNDATAEPQGSAFITHNVSSTDSIYHGTNSPVVGVTVTDNDPALAIAQTNIFTTVKEGGTAGTGGTPNVSDTFTVGMNGRNPATGTTVTVTLVPDGNVTVSPSVLTFTSSSTAAQTVTVTAVDDTAEEGGIHTGWINFSVTSNDTYFNGSFVPPIQAQVTDNDSPGITVVESSGTTASTEGGTGDSFTLALTKQPTNNVSVVVNGGTQSLVAGSATTTLNFTTINWSSPQTVSVSAFNDTTAELRHTAPITFSITGSSAAEYASLTNLQTVTHILTDNDNTVAGNVVRITESSSSTTVTESTTSDTFTVVLSQQPTANVVITFAPDSQLTVTPSTLTFIPGATGPGTFNVAQTVTVRAVDDNVIEPVFNWGQVTASVSSADPIFDAKVVTPVNSTVYDNDGHRITVSPSGGSTIVKELNATSDTYSIVLSHPPAAAVNVSISPDSQVTTDVTSLAFDNTNWNVPQTVTVTAVDDANVETTNHAGLVSHVVTSADPMYNGASVAGVNVQVWDNDSPGVDVSHTDGSTTITEGGSPDTLVFKLTQPPAPGTSVTITLFPPAYYVPPPQLGKSNGYFNNDQGGSNQRDNIVIDYTESILKYREVFYAHLNNVYGGTIPASPSALNLQNAHWTASKAIVDQMDLWFNGGSLKARHPVLIEPNQPPPAPLPAVNPRQAIIEAVYAHSGGANLPAATRYEAQIPFNPKAPSTTTFANDVRDRVRWCGYLMTVTAPGLVSH